MPPENGEKQEKSPPQQLLQQSAAAGAERDAHGDFAMARGSSGDQQDCSTFTQAINRMTPTTTDQQCSHWRGASASVGRGDSTDLLQKPMEGGFVSMRGELGRDRVDFGGSLARRDPGFPDAQK